MVNDFSSNDNQIIWSQRPDVINYTAYNYFLQVFLVILNPFEASERPF